MNVTWFFLKAEVAAHDNPSLLSSEALVIYSVHALQKVDAFNHMVSKRYADVEEMPNTELKVKIGFIRTVRDMLMY